MPKTKQQIIEELEARLVSEREAFARETAALREELAAAQAKTSSQQHYIGILKHELATAAPELARYAFLLRERIDELARQRSS